MSKIKHGGLFSGIGMFEYAANEAGFNNIYSCENNPFCREILKQAYPNSLLYGDINSLNTPPYVDVISGGFPCQDISYAKTHNTNGTFSANGIDGARSGLWWQYHRIIAYTKPKFAVIENVKALTKKGLDIVLQSLSDIGYNAEWYTLSAAQFGAPTKRERIWVVAYPDSYRREQESIIFSKIISKTIRYSPQWEFSRTICKVNGKKALPEYCGIPDGHTKGLYHAERIAAAGNAIVWVIAYEIFMTIKHILTNNTK